MQILRLDHLRSGTNDVDVTSPEGFPRGLPILQAKNQELRGPEKRPGTVSEVSDDCMLMSMASTFGSHEDRLTT